MRLRKITFVLLALVGHPAVSSAGPIEFDLTTGNIKTTTWAPELAVALQPYQPPGPIYIFDPAGTQPVTLPAVYANSALLPAPAARDLHPDGTTHWNNDGYFSVDVSVLDWASWESATLHFEGRAHTYDTYATQDRYWKGVTYFWFNNYEQVTLGGNLYTVWSDNLYTRDPATVHVWVGPNPPVANSPEPGTFALAALGLVPFGLRRLRRG